MDVFSGFLNWVNYIFPLLPAFMDPILSILCLLFVPEEEELYLLETFFFFFFFCDFVQFLCSVEYVAVFQFYVSLPHCNGNFVFSPFFRPTDPSVPFFAVSFIVPPH